MIAISRERVLGGQHSDTEMTFHNPGLTLAPLGRHVEAEAISDEVIEAAESAAAGAYEASLRVLGEQHPRTLEAAGLSARTPLRQEAPR